jgi:hypothetical protein
MLRLREVTRPVTPGKGPASVARKPGVNSCPGQRAVLRARPASTSGGGPCAALQLKRRRYGPKSSRHSPTGLLHLIRPSQAPAINRRSGSTQRGTNIPADVCTQELYP